MYAKTKKTELMVGIAAGLVRVGDTLIDAGTGRTYGRVASKDMNGDEVALRVGRLTLRMHREYTLDVLR